MGLLNFLLKLFKIKPGFNGSPEMLLAMAMEFQSRNNKEFVVDAGLQWGEGYGMHCSKSKLSLRIFAKK